MSTDGTPEAYRRAVGAKLDRDLAEACTCSADHPYLCPTHGTTERTHESARLFPQWVREDIAASEVAAAERATMWDQLLEAAPADGPVTFPRHIDLAHQHQEFTDTTAAYLRGEDVIPGDCWRACLASLLEVPLAEVPHFTHLYPLPILDPMLARDPQEVIEIRRAQMDHELHGPRWWLESIAWVERVRPGWTLRAWEPVGPVWSMLYRATLESDGLPRCILNGLSPRGDWNHSVLVDCTTHPARLEHDPFPGGEGVLEPWTDVVALVREEWL